VVLVCEVVAGEKRITQVKACMRTQEGKVCATCLHEKVQGGNPNIWSKLISDAAPGMAFYVPISGHGDNRICEDI
jgi:hypothetical protein